MKLQTRAWLKNLLKIQDRPMGFNVTKYCRSPTAPFCPSTDGTPQALGELPVLKLASCTILLKVLEPSNDLK